MCGIAGAFVLGPEEGQVAPGVVEKMTATLVHRGPDGCGIFRNRRAALGHRRLSIIDLSDDAAQPMFNEDRTLALVFNGEIYNFKELRSGLEDRGHRFRSRSDGEVILHLYEEHGTSCVEQLEGMFAFCIHDVRTQALYLGRDRVGEKPLYFAVAGNSFYFGSEIKALFASGAVPKRLSARGINAYFAYTQIPAPVTIFEGVHKLQPGHWMAVDRDGIRRIEPYWRLDFARKVDLSPEEAVDRLHDLMVDSVGKMLVSDVPLGMMLSGGVDSTLILAIAKEIGVRDIHTFTVGNASDGSVDEECIRALKMASRFGVSNRVFDFGQTDFQQVRQAAADCDEPIGLVEIFYLYGVFRQVSRHVKVVLTGNGADELFAGYTTYNTISRLSSAVSWARPIVSRSNAQVNALASRYYVHRNEAVAGRYFMHHRRGSNRESARLLDEGMAIAHYDNLLDAKLFADLSVLTNHGVSSVADTAGMVCSLELRSPFLHLPVIEFAASLTADLKIGVVSDPTHNKNVVKLLLSRYVDPADVYARKYGFGYFINSFDLMRTKWKEEIECLLFDEAIQDLKLFDMRNIAAIWQRFLKHELKFRERMIFTRYLMFAAWYKHSFLEA